MEKLGLAPSDFLILIVDDTEANVILLSHVLKAEGFNIMVAFNGADTLEILEARKPDLILLDVMMPEMSGYEVCSRINEIDDLKHIPVIFLSALSETSNKVEGFESGGVDYITKPFQKEEVLARIKNHLYLAKLQKEREEQIQILKEREAELENLNRKKDSLIRMVSHDIKNPLVGIVGITKMINERPDMLEQQKKEMLEAVEKSGAKLLDMVQTMLDNDSSNSFKEELNTRLVYLDKLIERVISVNKPKAIFKEIGLGIVDTDFEGSMILDEEKIEVLLNNLVSNALKFTPKGGKVSLSFSHEGDHGLFKVSDTGIGIPEESREGLFSAREDVKREVVLGTSGEKGTGLGLDVVLKYVSLHNGKIWVESKVGEGSTFYIQIPTEKR
ncbi:MAG: hybrid sensor histidine kinase/response regulator [Balneolaceae bacterium]